MSSRGVPSTSDGGSPKIMGRLLPASRSGLGVGGSSSSWAPALGAISVSSLSLSMVASDCRVKWRNKAVPGGGRMVAIFASQRDVTTSGFPLKILEREVG